LPNLNILLHDHFIAVIGCSIRVGKCWQKSSQKGNDPEIFSSLYSMNNTGVVATEDNATQII